MASLHLPATAAFDARVFAHNNPFMAAVPAPPPALPQLSQNAATAESLEVTVMWGSTVLSVAQLTPPRSYAVGEVGGSGGAGTSALGNIDFAMSADKLGRERREIIALRGGVPFAIFGANEAPRVFEKGKLVDASAAIVDCSDIGLSGARGIELRHDRLVVVEAAGVTFRVGGCEKPETVPRAVLGNTDRSAWFTMSGAAFLQGALIASLAYLTPSLAWGDEEDMNRDRIELMQQYLHASAILEHEQQLAPADPGGGEKGAPTERHRGPEGAAGNPTVTKHAHMAVAGNATERTLSRAELRAEASDFGTVGLLNTLNASLSPTSPWGSVAMGPDAIDAAGDLFSRELGEGAGMGGLGVSGTERGGGGLGNGVGISGISGTCFSTNCLGNGKDGFARSGALGTGTHAVKTPHVRMTNTTVSGHLPPEVIQRVVRQNFGRFRQCYELGLRSNPNLEGRVTARFVIGRDGAVSNVSAGGDLPDSQVRSCVASAFYGLSFPSPDSGIVTVTYPIMLTPG